MPKHSISPDGLMTSRGEACFARNRMNGLGKPSHYKFSLPDLKELKKQTRRSRLFIR